MPESFNISIKTLKSRKTVPFMLVPGNEQNSFTLLVDETTIINLSKEILDLLPKEKTTEELKKRIPYIDIKDPQKFLDSLAEYPAFFICLLDSRVIAAISSGSLSQALSYLQIDVGVSTVIPKFIEEKFTKALNEYWDILKQKDNFKNCPNCERGALLRKYYLKLIPCFSGWEKRTMLLKDCCLIFELDNDRDIDTYIENSKLQTLAHAYLKEKNDLQKKPGCTSCMINALKNKYSTLLRTIITTISYE